MIKLHYHWQKITKFCTPYAITHALEAMIKAKTKASYVHIAPLTVVWRGLRGAGLKRFFNRSMSVEGVCKGITETTKITARVDDYTVEISKLEFETIKNPTHENIKQALKKAPVVTYVYGGAHALVITEINDEGAWVIDSAWPEGRDHYAYWKNLGKITQIFELKPTFKLN
jgi:hypothetical protein